MHVHTLNKTELIWKSQAVGKFYTTRAHFSLQINSISNLHTHTHARSLTHTFTQYAIECFLSLHFEI